MSNYKSVERDAQANLAKWFVADQKVGLATSLIWSATEEARQDIFRLMEDYAALRGTPQTEEGLSRAVSARKHTQDWYAAHYGKLEDWARKRLPDPWRNEFFSCIANGTWGHDDVGEPYMSQVGRIVPSGYFKMDSASEQLLRDQTTRAENAEVELTELRAAGAPGAQRWIPVEERLPEFSGTYIVSVTGIGDDGDEHTTSLPADWSADGKYWHDLRGWGGKEVTHWMPIPTRLAGEPTVADPQRENAEIANLLTNVAQILDVVKLEWGEAWSTWDQEQRDSITKILMAGLRGADAPTPEEK
jgi:hypothetical protein